MLHRNTLYEALYTLIRRINSFSLLCHLLTMTKIQNNTSLILWHTWCDLTAPCAIKQWNSFSSKPLLSFKRWSHTAALLVKHVINNTTLNNHASGMHWTWQIEAVLRFYYVICCVLTRLVIGLISIMSLSKSFLWKHKVMLQWQIVFFLPFQFSHPTSWRIPADSQRSGCSCKDKRSSRLEPGSITSHSFEQNRQTHD